MFHVPRLCASDDLQVVSNDPRSLLEITHEAELAKLGYFIPIPEARRVDFKRIVRGHIGVIEARVEAPMDAQSEG